MIRNNSFQKHANLSLVAGMIWRQPGIPRVDIARALSIHRSTVSNLIGILLEKKVVSEGESGTGLPQGGRKPISLVIEEGFGVVLGLEIQAERWVARLVSISGKTILIRDGLPSGNDFPSVFDSIMKTVEGPIRDTGRPLLGICAGLPGVIDPFTGYVIHSDTLGLANFDFGKFVASRYRVPVIVENDANCCAWGDLMRKRGEGLSDFISVLVELHGKNPRSGIGVGMGIAIDGRVYYGSSFASGEFISMSRIAGTEPLNGLPDRDLEIVSSNPAARDQFMRGLFASLVPVVTTVDPGAVFLHGDLSKHDEEARNVMSGSGFEAVMKKGERLFEIVPDGDSVSGGAAALFLQRLFSVPELKGPGRDFSIDWDSVFDAVSRRGEPWVGARSGPA